MDEKGTVSGKMDSENTASTIEFGQGGAFYLRNL